MLPLNGSPSSSKTSSTAAVSSLRPRVRRLISIDDEVDPSSASDYDGPSPFVSRNASPIPSTRLPRASSTNRTSYQRSTSGLAPNRNNDNSPTLSNFWGNSWSAIQGLASNVLGSNLDTGAENRRRRPLAATHRRSSSNSVPKEWGPSGLSGSHVGTGTQEERENLVRAMKRRDLLTVDENSISDSRGRIKRRTSDESLNASNASLENEGQDALVYIHHVRPEDTIAGICIRYGCKAEVLRKANRLWPNDSVQIKKTVVIPVDACAVKGRPVPAHNEHVQEDLLGDFDDGPSNDVKNVPDIDAGINGRYSHSKQSSNPPRPPSSLQSSGDSDSPWKHDSWVHLPNNNTPIQIGRMPRRALGFFPPARRKSLAFSDASTPKPSLDVPRSSTSTNSPAISASHLNPLSGTNSPRRRPQRNRSLSSFSLHGPGGVGTLGKNVRAPGPAQDGLNKLFAQHLPNVAPPPDQEYFTPWLPGLLESDGSVQLGNSGARTPSAGAGIDLENIGGAIEGWMRKMASKASTIVTEHTNNNGNNRSGVAIIGAVGGGGDIGDLIELRDDAFEAETDAPNSTRAGGNWSDNLLAQPGLDHYQSSRADKSLTLRGRERRNEGGKTD